MKILNDGVTYFENNPTVQTDSSGNIIIMDDLVYPINGMSKEDCVSIYIVLKNGDTSSKILYKSVGNPGEVFTIPATDGYITFCHIVLPTEEYYNSHEGFTYYARENGSIYKNGNLVDIQEVIEVNNTSLIRHMHNFFSVYHLRRCYITLCLKLFKDSGFDRCFNNKVDTQLRYKRDLVWAALNVIQYMIDSNQLAEALRLLERINGCNGLCSGVYSGDNDCGCEK